MGKNVEGQTWFTGRQEQLLRLVGENKELADGFYLSGGTALSSCYYNHRISLDLDFFTPKEINGRQIFDFILSTKQKLGWVGVERFPTNVNGFKLVWNDRESLIVDFTLYTFKKIETGKIVFGVWVDSLIDICTNKLETILIRSNARDYVDLYTIMINEKKDFNFIKKLHQKKFEIRISDMEYTKAFLKSREVYDYPVMKVPFSETEMLKFFENEARKLGKNIFS